MDYPVSIGAELGLEGSDVEVTAGSENLPVLCPPNCPVEDSGTPDAGPPDSDAPDSGIPDSGIPDADTPDSATPDSETPDAKTPNATLPDAEIPDAATKIPEAGPSDDSPDSEVQTDSRVPMADAGRVDTGDDNGNPPPGCSCEVPGEKPKLKSV